MEDKSKVSPFSYETTSSSLSIGIMSLKSGFLSFSFNWLTDRARGVWFEAIRQKKKYLKIRIHLSLHMSNLIPPAFTHIRYYKKSYLCWSLSAAPASFVQCFEKRKAIERTRSPLELFWDSSKRKEELWK